MVLAVRAGKSFMGRDMILIEVDGGDRGLPGEGLTVSHGCWPERSSPV